MSFTDTSIARGMFNPPRFVSTLLPLSLSHHRSLKKRSILFSQATQKFSFSVLGVIRIEMREGYEFDFFD